MLDPRTLFLSLHVASGALGLLVGAFAFRRPEPSGVRLWAPRVYAGTLVSLAAFLTATVALDWTTISRGQQLTFSALIGLALVLVTRIFLALRVASARPAGWRETYLEHVYFTYISLWEGLLIVSLIDLGAPGWTVAAVAIGVVVIGATLFNTYKRQALAQVAA